MSEEIILECPACRSAVPYEDVLVADDSEYAKCPECDEQTPTDLWFG